jgi:hypothetical protein
LIAALLSRNNYLHEVAIAMTRIVTLIAFMALAAATLDSKIVYAAETGPVAIVEDVSFDASELQFMDLLELGRVIKLNAGQSVTLGYLSSCTREIITGGTITVGSKESKVSGSSMERELVDCDGGDLQLSTGQSQAAGAIVFRKAPTKGKSKPKPQRILYGVSPLIRFVNEAPLTTATILLERLDGKQEQHTIDIINGVADLARKNIALEPGGLYIVTAGDRKVVFRISPVASRAGVSVLGRLLAF